MKNEDDLDHKPLGNNAFAEGNKFYIMGVINSDLKKEIILPLTRKIDELSNQREPVIDFIINSPGGYCHIMWHIVELIELAKRKSIKVRTIVYGMAYSAASMIAITGTPGERYIDEHAEHLPHYGTAYGSELHTPLQAERDHAWNQRHFARLREHYEKYANIPALENKIKDDNFFVTAEQSLKWSLADKYTSELE